MQRERRKQKEKEESLESGKDWFLRKVAAASR